MMYLPLGLRWTRALGPFAGRCRSCRGIDSRTGANFPNGAGRGYDVSGPSRMNSFGYGSRAPRAKALPEARGEKRPAGGVALPARKPAIMQEPVLVLNATFEPINVTAVRRAM